MFVVLTIALVALLYWHHTQVPAVYSGDRAEVLARLRALTAERNL